MANRITDEEFLDRREARRLKADAKAETAIARREDAADAKIGELCREGKTVFYVVLKPGRYREATTRRELIDFLIRNRYV